MRNAHRTLRTHQRIYYLKWVLFFAILCKRRSNNKRSKKTSSKSTCLLRTEHLTAHSNRTHSRALIASTTEARRTHTLAHARIRFARFSSFTCLNKNKKNETNCNYFSQCSPHCLLSTGWHIYAWYFSCVFFSSFFYFDSFADVLRCIKLNSIHATINENIQSNSWQMKMVLTSLRIQCFGVSFVCSRHIFMAIQSFTNFG